MDQRVWWVVWRGASSFTMNMTVEQARTFANNNDVRMEKAVLMTAYSFNKQLQDAYAIGKHGPIEVDLDGLLEEVVIIKPQKGTHK